MQATILAAGRGERMKPLTRVIPKPLLPIDGVPVLESTIQTLKQCDIKKIVVVTGHLREKIEKFIESKAYYGIDITYVYQDKAKGSGDALLKAKEIIRGDFITMASDTVFNTEEIGAMIAEFKCSKPNALIGLKQVPHHQLGERSSVRIEQNDYIAEIIEKPRENRNMSDVSAVPIYIFSPKIWPYLERLKVSDNGKYELATATQELIDNEGKVKGYFISYSRDITRPIDIIKENFSYLADMIS